MIAVGGERSGADRVKRGGSWDNDAANLRTSNRDDDDPSDSDDNIGARCCSSRMARRVSSTDTTPAHEVRDHRSPSRAGQGAGRRGTDRVAGVAIAPSPRHGTLAGRQVSFARVST